MMDKQGIYRIEMDGRWGLKDLYDFPHALSQTYAYTYCFETDLPARDAERIDLALQGYPWGGGYSVVNMYFVLQNQVPKQYRPQISSIQYASPGWIDLLAHLDVIVKVAGSVAAIAASAVATTKSYSAIQKILQDIRTQRAKSKVQQLQLTRQQVQEMYGLCNDLSQTLGYKQFDDLVNRADGNTETAAKMLSAQYRRLSVIADYHENGKALMPPSWPAQMD
jgi:hypothetical protein